MIIAATVIKKELVQSDAKTNLMIHENPYVKYFVGLYEFTGKLIFDSFLLVTIRKHIDDENLNFLSISLL